MCSTASTFVSYEDPVSQIIVIFIQLKQTIVRLCHFTDATYCWQIKMDDIGGITSSCQCTHTKYTKYYDILIGGQSCLVQQGWDRVVGECSTQYQNRCTHHCSITILLYDGSMKWLSHMLSHWFTFPLNLSVVTTTLLSSFTTVSMYHKKSLLVCF